MPRKDKYYPDYIKMYPCLKEREDILQALRQSDRKMKYIEVDLKQEQCAVDQTQQSASFQPSREDSYERLTGENGQEFASSENVEELICREDEVYRLHIALLQLDNPERALINALFLKGSQKDSLRKGWVHHSVLFMIEKSKYYAI